MSSEFLQLWITQTWQIATLAIVVAIVARFAAKNRPQLAHALWILVLIKCVTPPLWGHSLGVFSQLQAKFASDVSTSAVVEPETNTMTLVVPSIALPAANVERSFPEDRSLKFFEHDEFVSDLDAEFQFEVGSIEHNDNGIEHDEAPSAVAGAIVNSSKPTANYTRFRSALIVTICTGAIITLLIMMFRCLRCVRLIHRQRTTEFDEPLRNRIQQLARQLRIRRTPQIIVSDVLFGPAVFGLLRHTIVLPRCLFEDAEGDSSRYFLPERIFAKAADVPTQEPTSAQRQNVAVEATSSVCVAASREILPRRQDLQFLDPILAHELLHIRRGDLRTGTLQAFVQSLWWFHPAVWFANRLLSREAERCCDEQVIAELGCTPGRYARSLLSVIECKHRLQPIPVFPGMKPVEITTQRMERIMSLKNGLMKRTPIWCWLMIVALALVVLPGAANQPAADEAKPAVLLKMEDRVNNPLTTKIRLDDNFVLSQDVPVMSGTVIAHVNNKSITVGSLLAESSTALLLKHLPEMTESGRRRIVANAIKKSLPTYLYQEVVLQHFCVNLSAEQQALLAAAQEKRDAELLAMLPGVLEQSKVLVTQEDLLELALRQYKRRDQAANGELSRLCRAALVARCIEGTPATDVVCERDATLLHCRELLLQARMRNDVSLRFSNTSLTDVMRSIATDYGINIAVKTRAVEKPATVTFHCENEPLDEALNTILEPLGLCVRLHQETVMIDSADSKRALANGATTDSKTTTNLPIEERAKVDVNEKHDTTAAAKEPIAVAERLFLCSYPVADLVASRNPVITAVSRTGDPDHRATQAVVPAGAVAIAPENSTDQTAPKPISQPKDGNDIRMVAGSNVDFAPLTELIKATVQPETWGPRGNATIAIEREILSFVIRQTEAAHDEIADLLSHLRNDQDANVRIQCRIVQLTKDSQTTWLEKQCSLHPLKQRSRWGLLAHQRSEAFAQALLEQEPEVLSVPTVMTISGQTATISVGQSAQDGTAPTEIRLEMTPHLLPESNVIRLQHAFSMDSINDEMPEAIESLVGSGQTLLLLINAPAGKENATAEKSHYLMMLTPEYMPRNETAERVLNPDESDKLNRAVRDGNMIRVTPHGSEVAPHKKFSDTLIFGKGVNGISELEADKGTGLDQYEKGVTWLTGSSVVATVNGKPVLVDDILGGVRRRIEADPILSDERHQMILLQSLRTRTRDYTGDELVIQAMEATIPEDKRKLIRDSLEPAFQAVCQKMMNDQKMTTDDELDRWLESQGFTRSEMKDTFIRRQFVVGYLQSKMQVPTPIDRAVLVKYFQEHIDEYTRVEVSQVADAPRPTTVEFEAVQEEIQNKLLGQLREEARKHVLAEIWAKGHVITIFDGETPAE